VSRVVAADSGGSAIAWLAPCQTPKSGGLTVRYVLDPNGPPCPLGAFYRSVDATHKQEPAQRCWPAPRRRPPPQHAAPTNPERERTWCVVDDAQLLRSGVGGRGLPTCRQPGVKGVYS